MAVGHDCWTVESELELSFRAAGFRQIMRREPMHVAKYLTMELREGLSFSEQPYDAGR